MTFTAACLISSTCILHVLFLIANPFFFFLALIVGGDFNCIDKTIDKLNCSSVLPTDVNSLCSLKSDFSLMDVWRKQNPRKILFTWSNSDCSQMSRIDRFFLAKSLFSNAVSSDVLPCALSDHDFIKLEVALGGFSSHRANVWRFNNSLLSDPKFTEFISDVIADSKLKIPNFPCLRVWWDHLKVEIRDACIKYASGKRKSANQERFFLTKRLIRARNAFHVNKSDDTPVINSLECRLFTLI